MIFNNILESIGNTPLVTINRLNPNKKVAVVGKLESSNPGGSVKERIALSMIEAGERSGELTKDKIVLEATSGNTGIGLAMVCAAKGYRCLLVMPESASVERRKIMQAYGARDSADPGRPGTDGAIEKAYAMAREYPDRYFLTDQFNNEANWQAHYNQTAPEIWQQTGGQVTHMVATLGTSGTVMGLCAWFQEFQPQVQIIAVEPHLGHKIQGLKNMKESYKPGIFDKSAPDRIVNIDDDEAFETASKLARQEGILVGMSSGAAMFAALEMARELEQGLIVAILPDGGERYLSTPLFTPRGELGRAEEVPASVLQHDEQEKGDLPASAKGKGHLLFLRPDRLRTGQSVHCRRFVVADLIVRYLEARGYKVHSYMNFTDLDDNTIEGAGKAGWALQEFTQNYIDGFLADIDTLGVKKATGYPKASEHVRDMIEISHELHP